MKFCEIENCSNKLWAKGLCSSHYVKQWEKDNPEKHKINTRRGWLKNLHKVRARNLVNTHIKRGKLQKQPCGVCGELKVHAHHEDYTKPLDVMWLCRIHHIELHSNCC